MKLVHGSETATMNRVRRITALTGIASLLSIVFSVSGCGKGSDLRHVSGEIKYRNVPLSNAGISFYPSSGRPVTAAVTEGKYNVQLKPGDYTVTIIVGVELPQEFKEGDPVPPPKVLLSEVYTSRTKSKLNATVGEKQSDPIDFDLK